MPELKGVLESVLYTTDMTRAREFFEDIMELEPLKADARFTAYPLTSNMLLVFQQGETGETVHLPSDMGTIPPHDGAGRQHLAFGIASDALEPWVHHLESRGVAIEGRTHWPRGGESVYFRDPDGHLLELVTPGIWPMF